MDQIKLYVNDRYITICSDSALYNGYIISSIKLLLKDGYPQSYIDTLSPQKVVDEAINKREYNNKRKDRHHDYREFERIAEYEYVDNTFYPSTEDTALNAIVLEETKATVRSLLNPEQCEIVFMHMLDGLTLSEVANLMGDKGENIKKKWQRAIKKLQKNKNLFVRVPNEGLSWLKGVGENKPHKGEE